MRLFYVFTFMLRLLLIDNKISVRKLPKNKITILYKLIINKGCYKNRLLIYWKTFSRILNNMYMGFSLATFNCILSELNYRYNLSFTFLKDMLVSIYQKYNKRLFKSPINRLIRSKKSADLNLRLRPGVVLYDHQEFCKVKLCIDNTVKSGYLILPCGSGKTLVGILIMSYAKTVILCIVINFLMINQWKEQIFRWTYLKKECVIEISSYGKTNYQVNLQEHAIFLSTYKIISFKGIRKGLGVLFNKKFFFTNWDLIIFDECHLIRTLGLVKTFCIFYRLIKLHSYGRVGLTAIFKLDHGGINYCDTIIGPKLVNVKWKQLTHSGSISFVKYYEILIDLPLMDQLIYKNSKSNREKFDIATMNPNKIEICRYLIKYFLYSIKFNILIFCDSIKLHNKIRKALKIDSISGKTSKIIREKLIKEFKANNNKNNAILFSKVGDTSVDIPNANLIIQISSDRGSSVQEIQRIGRIMRANNLKSVKKYSIFINLISKNTVEHYYSKKRKSLLARQDFSIETLKTKVKKLTNKKMLIKFYK
ncbi:DNA repair and transcription protein (nucleomorph) [Bigelowiella natans]|uniref:DNA 3'-5' helicase n=1 Tax=Bigelowiella natans TaxID=227086 RepID=Q3LWK8_BIGNA|nr:DNA repair and transcription protein [Bigelowiella natans]ABA27158.1 DNA repair and transcription protein [Bigelowiella natans]